MHFNTKRLEEGSLRDTEPHELGDGRLVEPASEDRQDPWHGETPSVSPRSSAGGRDVSAPVAPAEGRGQALLHPRPHQVAWRRHGRVKEGVGSIDGVSKIEPKGPDGARLRVKVQCPVFEAPP